jgi:glutamyl-tRNA reductase
LRLIVQGAIRAGKRVRNETAFGRNSVSISHAAVAKAEEILGDLRNRGVLLVGAGAMSQVALRLLRARGIDRIYLTSRTLERADQIAKPMGGQAVEFEAMDEIIDRVDIIISSSSAPYHLFDPVRVNHLQQKRGARPLLILDIAVPRDVDPEAGRVPGVHLLNLDDLRSVAATGLEGSESWTPAAERIVEEELAATRRSLDAREAAPTVRALVRRMEELRDRELERHLARVPDPQSREAMRALAESLTAKFLHGPIRSLRQSPDPRQEAGVFTQAFDLKPEEKS